MVELNPNSILNDERIAGLLNDAKYSARRDLLKEVIEIAFIASLHLSEGRKLRFAIAIEHEVVRTTNVHLFDPPIPLEARYLQSLSPAFSESEDCFIVEGGSHNGNSLMIVGTAVLPPRAEMLPFSHKPMVVSVNGPGRICLQIGEVKVVYDRGVLSHCNKNCIDKLWENIAPDFVGKVSTPYKMSNGLPYGLYGHPSLDVGLWEAHKSDYVNIAEKYCPVLLSEVVAVIVTEIERAEHGGAFMLLPSTVQKDKIFQEYRWYSSIRRELSEAICKSLSLHSICTLALQGKWIYPEGVLPTVPDDLEFWVKRIVFPELTDSFDYLRRQCDRIAHLANADGAVVLNTMFDLEAFSAKLKLKSENNTPSLPAELAIFLGPRGNRHNSMARAVATVPDAIGIVVSQDGNVTCFNNNAENGYFELIL